MEQSPGLLDSFQLARAYRPTIRVLCLVLALAGSAFAQAPSDFGRLRPQTTRTLALAAGQKQRFHVTAGSGSFIHVVVEKKGIDCVLSILDPQGREVLSANSPNGAYGFEHVSAIAEQAGAYTIEVTAKGEPQLQGQYSITLRMVRAPTEDDRLRLRAETLFRTAVDGDRAGDDASLRRAIDSYAAAAQLFERLNEPYLEALAFHRLGFVYDGLHEPAKALELYNRALPIRRMVHDRAGEASTLNNIGLVYLRQGDKPKALKLLGQALQIRLALNDRVGLAASFLGLARASGNPKALDYLSQALALARAMNDRPREAFVLQLIGNAVYELGDKRRAVESYGQALTVYRALGDREGEATMLNYMATTCDELGEPQKALDLHSQSLPIFHALGDRANEAAALHDMGEIHRQLGEGQAALELYNQALTIRHAAGDRAAEAATLDSIGSVYNTILSDKQQALGFYNRALAMRQAEGDRKGEADSLNNIGTVYSDLRQTEKAREIFDRALSMLRALGDREGEAQTLGNIGIVYSFRGDKQKALELYGQALSIKRTLGDRAGEAATLNNMASACSELGEQQKALEYYNQAAAITRSLGDRLGEAAALGNMGSVYSGMGEQQKALDFYTQALTIERAAGARAHEADSLTAMGRIYSDLGEQQKALEYYNQALPIHRATGDRAAEAATLHNIGVVYRVLGENQKALDLYLQSLSIFRAVGDRWNEARMLSNIGDLSWDPSAPAKAMEYYGQALATFRAGGDRTGEAAALDHMGGVWDGLGERQKALDFYNRALPMWRAVGERAGEAGTLNNLGAVYDELGQKPRALELYRQALGILRAVGDREGEAKALSNLRVLFAESQPDLAIFFGKQAVNVLQTVRGSNQGLPDSLRRTYEKKIESYYRNLAALLVERQRFAEAEEVLGLLKDKETGIFLQRDAVAGQLRSVTLLDSEKAALARYEQVVGQVVALGQKKAALLAKAENEALSAAERAQSDQLDSDLGAANLVLQRFFDEQEKSFAADSAAARRIEEFREAESIQGRLAELGPDVVAIYTLVAPEKYIAVLVTAGASKAYTTVIKESDLNAKIFQFRQQLQNPASDPLPLARELYRIVFPEGLRQDLEAIGARTIMWSMDGALRYIPMAALHDGHDYLVKRFRNSLITPASMDNLKETPQARWQGVGFGVSEARAGFAALPSVPAELHSIFRQQGAGTAPLPGTIRLDAEFTRDAFLNDLRQPNHRVVHIATHFDSRPLAANSHLLLGDGNQWSLQEIRAVPRLFQGVDLLTLSACSTAFTNRSEDGREVDSFGTIAQQLGARSVIASLWSVNDEATAQLMQTMYRLRQQNPALGKSEALRQAQDQMASGTLRPATATGPEDRGVAPSHPAPPATSRDWRHPYYWAPFILIGNWK